MKEEVHSLGMFLDPSLSMTSARPIRWSQAGRLRVLSLREAQKTIRNQAFSTVAPQLWNSLLPDVRLAPSLGIFKKLLKTWLFRLAFPE